MLRRFHFIDGIEFPGKDGIEFPGKDELEKSKGIRKKNRSKSAAP
jgi:hypothetical protein